MGPPRLLPESPVYPRALGMGRAPRRHLERRGGRRLSRAVPYPSRCRGGVSRCGRGGVPRRRKTRLRLETGAEAGVSYGIPSEAGLPASFSRRRAGSRSGCVRDLPSGVVFSPEGASAQRWRTEPSLRRHFGAGGRFSYGIPSETAASASIPRRRAGFRSKCVRDRRCGVIFSPEAR